MKGRFWRSGIMLCALFALIAFAAQAVSIHTHVIVMDPAVAATCTGTGRSEGEHCSVCNEVITPQEAVPPLGHHWMDWSFVENANTHTAVCRNGCGETLTVRCVNFPATLSSGLVNVCAICGKYKNGVFERIPDAAAVPIGNSPSNQRGTFTVRGKALPFADEDPAILYAFTMAYEWNGGVGTFKNKSTVTIPIGVELPEQFLLIRVDVSSGDDSVQRHEEWTEIEHSYTDGVLSFETKNPALYLIKPMK